MTLVSTRTRWQQLAALEGLISEESGMVLAELAAQVPEDQMVVNVGVFKGKSVGYLAEGARLGKGAHVLGIDPWDLPGNPNGRHQYHRAQDKAYEQLQAVMPGDNWGLRRAFSKDVAETWEGPKVGLLFIDGDHAYESVRADWHAWFPHLYPHGVVVFDDYNTKRNPGVKQFVQELRQDRPQDHWQLYGPLAVCQLGTAGAVTYPLFQHGVRYLLSKPAPHGDPALVYSHGGRLDADLREGHPYEAKLLEDIRRTFLQPYSAQRTFVDVGAHVGNHTIYLAKVCGLQVHAFEPDHEAFHWLEHNVDMNRLEGSVHTYQVALGNTEGYGDWSPAVPGLVVPGEGNIPLRRLDDYELENVVGIKVDVEGLEYQVLQGADATIDRCKPVIWAEYTDDTRLRHINHVLEPLGYRRTTTVKVASPLGRWEYAA